MSDKIRLFIAVRFSSQIMDKLARLMDRLRGPLDRRADIKWVKADNIHLTLQFLGDVDQGLLPKLTGSLTGAYLDVQSFQVSLSQVGAFPKPNRARVIWVGITHGSDGLKALHAATMAVTEEFGFEPEDRPFKAHVTLARIRTRANRMPDLSKPLQGFSGVELGKCQIREVHLVKSELRPNGPRYTTLDTFPIGR